MSNNKLCFVSLSSLYLQYQAIGIQIQYITEVKTEQAYTHNKKAMNLQYITDPNGHKNAVQLPLKDWEKIQKDLDELGRLRNKKLFFTELAEAVEELKLIKEGKIQARNAEDFFNEL